MKVKVSQSCLTLCNPTDYTVHGILQAGILEWVAYPLGSIPGLGISPGVGNGNPLQYSCLGNPLDGGAWQTTVCGVTKRWT